MIVINEQPTKKVVGETSLFVKIPYRKEYVEFIHTLGGCNFSKSTKEWEIPLIHLSKVLDYFCEIDDIELNLKKDIRQSKNCQSIIATGDSYKLKPFDYQLEGIQYGLDNKKWLLLDPPGLGKSAQIIHIVEELKNAGQLEHCLIICGVNSIKSNWKQEISKHSNLTSVILGEKETRTGSKVIGSVKERVECLKKNIPQTIVITNIETLRDDDIVKTIENGPNKFDMIVVDEIHTCKNPNSKQGDNLLKLKKFDRKIAATGTLLVNTPLDAYVPLKFIDVENSTYTNFKYFYCVYQNNFFVGYKNVDFLKDIVKKHSLRRSKDILNLPPLTIVEELVEMEDAQQRFYESVKKGIKEEVDKVNLNASSVRALITRLRQATAFPSILTTSDIPSAKIQRCIDLVDQIVSNGDKVIVYSTFRDTAEYLYQALKHYGATLNTGNTKDSVVQENKDKFQSDPNSKVFVATWQKCGTGITLTAANYVIFIDTPWTDAVRSQAIERAYRIGTTKNVVAYILTTKDTIDEQVNKIVSRKGALSNYVVDDDTSDEIINELRNYLLEL